MRIFSFPGISTLMDDGGSFSIHTPCSVSIYHTAWFKIPGALTSFNLFFVGYFRLSKIIPLSYLFSCTFLPSRACAAHTTF